MRIGVCGAGGRMGREVCRAVAAEEDLELACAVDPAFGGEDLSRLVDGVPPGIAVAGDVGAMSQAAVDVMVDFTIAEAARENLPRVLRWGIHCVVGTTGFSQADLDELGRSASEGGVCCLVAPNFALGAVLMMHFARRAARYLERCEIIELHHAAKLDAPSGTALNTARLILEEKGLHEAAESAEGPRGFTVGDINIHSVRLPGLVAHQEVIFGGPGQVLTIRHDSTDRTSFMPGVLMAVRSVVGMRGLLVGLESIMEL
ncbi:MAG: 4-hydroxy-tetrahydrodipicolinate reductase [Actinobacteria bacterium]|nr:4-hydroxy-tetrahydrodipicolinate reductase [Actinomycetota bacterium]